MGHFTKQMSFRSVHHNMCNAPLPSHSKCHSCLFAGTWAIQPSSANTTFAVLGNHFSGCNSCSLTATSSVNKHGSQNQLIFHTKNSSCLYLNFKSDKHSVIFPVPHKTMTTALQMMSYHIINSEYSIIKCREYSRSRFYMLIPYLDMIKSCPT